MMQTQIATSAPWPYRVGDIPVLIKPKYTQSTPKEGESNYGALTEGIKAYVRKHPGALQSEIRQAMNISPTSMASVLAKLVKRRQLFKVRIGHWYRYSTTATTDFGRFKAKPEAVQKLPVMDELYEVPTITRVVIDYERLIERLRQGPVVVLPKDISKWMYHAIKTGQHITRKESYVLHKGVRTKVWTVQIKDET